MFPSEHDKMVKKWWADGGDYQLRFAYNLSASSFVVDLGGYQGQWASDLFGRYKCRIAIFEPVEAFAKNIKERFKHNSSMEVFAFGLGSSTRLESIGVSADGSSVFKNAAQREKIRIVDVIEWLRARPESVIDLLKINIEGGEYELLERLIETGLINTISNIQVQFHDVALNSADRMKNIQERLKGTHEPTYQYRFVWENWTRLR
jgi:FkbM family methyltransferase